MIGAGRGWAATCPNDSVDVVHEAAYVCQGGLGRLASAPSADGQDLAQVVLVLDQVSPGQPNRSKSLVDCLGDQPFEGTAPPAPTWSATTAGASPVQRAARRTRLATSGRR